MKNIVNTIKDKLNKIIETKKEMKDTLNSLSSNTIHSETPFIEYAKQILKLYIKEINKKS